MKKLCILISSLAMLMILKSVAFTQVANDFIPTMINYQGFLTDQNSTALNGSYQITFALYSDATSTTSNVWNETHSSILVENGLFNVLLGSIDTLTASDLIGERYLGIRVAGEPEMTPRMRLASAAYSLVAENANQSQNAIYADSADNAQNAIYSKILSASDGDPINAVIVDADGNVGIGEESPAANLDVNGTIKVDNASVGSAFDTYYISYNGTLTANVWTTLFSGSFMPTGVYIMKAYLNTYMAGGNSYRETYSAVFSWFAEGTNSGINSVISTHQAGHAPNNEIIIFQFHRVVGNLGGEFQIRSNLPWNGSQTAQFTFLRIL